MKRWSTTKRWITRGFALALVGLAICNALAGNTSASVMCSSTAAMLMGVS